ncbi:MAG: hypothetical protein HY530_08570 [Chloroflexi bacterium]|nr:hypothetical protein [Chloroflexota bacterium]
MIIKRAGVKRLRAISKEREVAFFPGLNIIKGGDNEAGKSSLRIAITKALFQDPTTSQRDILALTSWGTDEPWEVALDFEVDGESYRITKNLKDRIAELVGTGSFEFVATSKNTIADKIAEITGCPSEIFFESTACISQDELIRIVPKDVTSRERQNAIGIIAQRLQSKLSGTEETDVVGILSKLYHKTHRKDAGGPYSNLQRIAERAAHLRSQKLAQEDKVKRIMESRQSLNRVREELERLGQDLPAKQDILGKNKRILELQKEIARDKAQYDTFRRARELKSKLDGLDEELKRLACFTGAEGQIEQLGDFKRKLEDIARQRARLQEDIKALQGQKPALWVLLLGSVLMAGGLAGLIVSRYLLGAVAVGFPFLVYWLVSRMAWRKQVNSASQKAAELESQSKDNGGQAGQLLKALGFEDYNQYEGQLAEYRGKIEARKGIGGRLDAVLAGKGWPEFVAENTDLDVQMSARMKEMEQLEPFKLEPLALQKLENEVKRLQQEKEQLERDKSAFEKFFELTDVDTDQLVEIEEELSGLDQEKEFWEIKRKVFQLTRDVLDEAHKQTVSKAADLLERELSRYIATVTDGRYSQVKIDEGDLSVRTFSPEKQDWVDVDQLSRATQDQFYICARFALVRLITQGKRPPILLDDPFVNFHPKRLKKMVALLQELAKENQILLFTCSDAYDYLGNVILLD